MECTPAAGCKLRLSTTAQEVIGYTLLALLLFGLSAGAAIIWSRDFAIPISTSTVAECLVLSSVQTSRPQGFGRDEIYRAEITVHVFNTKAPECCCPDRDGKPRCKEWNGVAYDTASGIYTPGHKTEFLQWYGHPGNFYPCWVSPDKEMVLMTHEWQSEFLMVPIIAVVFAIVALYMAISRICRSLPVRMRLPQYRQLPTKEHARREQHERTDRR